VCALEPAHTIIRARDVNVDPGQRPSRTHRGAIEINLGQLEGEQFTLAEAGGARQHSERFEGCAPRRIEEAARLIGIHRRHLAVLHPGRRHQRCRIRRNQLPPQRLLEGRTQGRMGTTDGGRRESRLEEVTVGSLHIHRLQASQRDAPHGVDQVEADVFLVAVPGARSEGWLDALQPIGQEPRHRLPSIGSNDPGLVLRD
jgi:hypothetical protein